MPLFIFISGRFSYVRDSRKYLKGMLGIFETYLVFQAIKTFARPLFFHENIGWSDIYAFFMGPGWTLWFLLSLLWWRLIVLVLHKILDMYPRLVLLLCFVISVFAGFIPIESQLSFQRTMAFLPFFFMGYYSNKFDIKGLVNKFPRGLSITILCAIGGILYFMLNDKIPALMVSRSSSYFVNLSFSPAFCAVIRCAIFFVAIIMGIGIMRLVSINNMMADWGRKTMFIYIYHSFIITALRTIITNGYLPFNSPALFFYAVCITFGLVMLSYVKIFNWFLTPISGILKKIQFPKV